MKVRLTCLVAVAGKMSPGGKGCCFALVLFPSRKKEKKVKLQYTLIIIIIKKYLHKNYDTVCYNRHRAELTSRPIH